jgi:hypothetical protein
VVEVGALLAGCVGIGETEGETADVGAGVLVEDRGLDGVVVDEVVIVTDVPPLG